VGDDQGREEREEKEPQETDWRLERDALALHEQEERVKRQEEEAKKRENERIEAERRLREEAEMEEQVKQALEARKQEERIKREQEEAQKRENEQREAERKLREEAEMEGQVKQALEAHAREEQVQRQQEEARKRENEQAMPGGAQLSERNDIMIIKSEPTEATLPEGDDMGGTFHHPDSFSTTQIGLEPGGAARSEMDDMDVPQDDPNSFSDHDGEILNGEDEDLPELPSQPPYDHRRTRDSNFETMADFVYDFLEYYAVHSRTSIDTALDCIIAHRLSNSRATNPYNVYLSLRREDPDEQERLRALGIPTKGRLLMNVLLFTSLS
jgi:hypothetical protein